MPPLLVTIGPSHYCEKARWGLDHGKIRFREEAHAPLIHWLFTLTRTGTRTVPLLIDGNTRLTDSSDILAYADRNVPDSKKLYPTDLVERREVLALEDRFDEELGPLARRLAYAHLVDAPELFVAVMTDQLGGAEAGVVRAMQRPLRAALRRAFGLRAGVGDRMFAKAKIFFDEIGARLADGRKYLVASRFTAADLTFASLSVPLLHPTRPGLEGAPPGYAEQVRELRATPAGQFALRMYREER